ncbi:MAG: hypothetical protein DHS20C17_17600 [Cyclobacteriaceae bacterium]|nr:MAG: hypothetical protein DHS20C17_17600 [Cyclobacteriaceae bacterium]
MNRITKGSGNYQGWWLCVIVWLSIFQPFVAPAQQNFKGSEDTQKISQRPDWLLAPESYKAIIAVDQSHAEITLENGLIRRTFRVAPNGATVGLDNLITGESLLRGVKPEGSVKIDGVTYQIGGLDGQPNYAYLKPEWLDQLTASPSAMQFEGYETGQPQAPFEWKRVRHHAPGSAWPPKGVYLRMDYSMPDYQSLISQAELLPSDYGRSAIYNTDFQILDPGWTVTNSGAHPRSSFENEGKPGEIYTPQNTSVFVERDLDENARIVEATFDVGTDKSKQYGPGITLVWPDKTVKFYLRPGGSGAGEGPPWFGLWDGEKEINAIGGGQELDLSQPWSLRFRITDTAVFCEAKPKDGNWILVKQLAAFDSMPDRVRLGKTNGQGNQGDDESPGELVRLHVSSFATYESFKLQPISDLQKNIKVSVHYELYDGIPVMAKWLTVENRSGQAITVNDFTSEIIAAVEYGAAVESREYNVPKPNIHVETDYAFSSFDVQDANHHAVRWNADPQYLTQVNYQRKTPCLLEVGPELGPEKTLGPGEQLKTFRTFVMPYDSYDRERQGLALRRMYRTLAPWSTENPLMMHARFADWDRVKIAIDQAAEAGFEMVILTFGSGFNIEDDSQQYLQKMKQYADYAKSKGVEIGGYSLLASRKIDPQQDVVMPEGMRPTFGNSPCIGSEWGQEYFKKLYNFYQTTGFALLEHDGSYPGDVCISQDHPGHKGYEDSRWEQYATIAEFYQWCRSRGVYLNIPDYYYLTGGSKCGMGYREVNWSLPREQQPIHTRQNIYDGSWQKTPSMGWMFVPLTEYQGGGAAATIEPLNEHLDHYENMMVSNLGGGVQACYRGPRLYDSPETKAMVTRVVNWFKQHREVLEGDIIHLKRANGRDLDYWLNVNPQGEEKGMLMVYNPENKVITKKLKVPLYYTGLIDQAVVQTAAGAVETLSIDRDYSIALEVTVPANGYTWALIK